MIGSLLALRDELQAELEIGQLNRRPLRAGDSIIAYGAGRGGRQLLALARECRLNVLFVCDDNPACQSGAIDGIPLRPPEAIRNHPDTPVIIALAQYQNVVARLRDWSVHRRYFSDDLRSHIEGPSFEYVRGYFDADTITRSWDELEQLDNLLADEHSRTTLRAMLKYRLSRNLEHSRECPYRQYHHPLVQARAGDVIFDGGAWTGDTAVPFAQAAGANGHVFAFEPAPPTFAMLKKNIHSAGLDHVITPVNRGLGQAEGERRFSFADSKFGSSHINASGELTIRLTSIDLFCQSQKIRPSLIKMDIEGAEPDALEGARQTILAHRPKLQICLYHKPADLWEIPLQIHQLCPSYQFYLGQHERELAETVIYAIAPGNH